MPDTNDKVFLFVTANDHEREAFEDKFVRKKERYIKGKTYYQGIFGRYPAAYIHIEEQGPTAPAAIPLVNELVRELHPVAVIMVGIAFGADESIQKIGDVLVSEKILPHDARKILETGTIYKDSPKEVGFQLLNAFREHREWSYLLPNNKYSTVHVGAVLTGSPLINNYDFRTQLLKDFATFQPIGGEMESQGIYSMCRIHSIPEWIIVKGISDWGYNKGNPNKDRDQITAAKAAVDYCLHVFSRDGVFNSLTAPSVSSLVSPALPSGTYHINLPFINQYRSYKEKAKALSKSLYYKISGDISDIFTVVFNEQNIPDHKLIDIAFDALNTDAAYGDDLMASTQILLLIGDGGIGKTTLLVQIAQKLSENTETDVFLCQFASSANPQHVDELISFTDDERKTVILLDSPADNPDIALKLFELIRSKENIILIVSERANRMSLLLNEINTGFINESAKAILIHDAASVKNSMDIVRRQNRILYSPSEEWKSSVIHKMIENIKRNVEIDDILMERSIKLADFSAPLCVVFLKICLYYNKHINGNSLQLEIPLKFDWNEWNRIFETDNGFPDTPGHVSLKDAFPFIAAFGLFKIPVNVNYLSNMLKVHVTQLIPCLIRKLKGQTEPAHFEDGWVTLKHDVIADLYFLATPYPSPQYYLDEALKYLDPETVILYEKNIFSSKYLMRKRELPFDDFDLISLAKKFEAHKDASGQQDYLEILKAQNRFFSFAGVQVYIYQQQDDWDECKFQQLWTEVLSQTPAGRGYIKTWGLCFKGCLESGFEPPKIFYEVNDKVDYRIVTCDMTSFQKYASRNQDQVIRYRQIAKKIYQIIASEHPEDIPCRLALADILEQQEYFDSAENVLTAAANKNTASSYIACISLAELCKRLFMKCGNESPSYLLSPKGEIEPTNESKHYREKAEHYYRLSIEKAAGKEKSKPLCALARFLPTIDSTLSSFYDYKPDVYQKHVLEAKALFLQAIQYGGATSSACNGLAMLCSNPKKDNICFDISLSEQFYFEASKYCPNNMKVTRLVPWGNFLYNIGNLSGAENKYREVLDNYAPNEINAINGIAVVEKEQLLMQELLHSTPTKVNCLSDLFRQQTHKSHKKSRKKAKKPNQEIRYREKLFRNEITRREVFRIILITVNDPRASYRKLKECTNIMHSLIRAGNIKPHGDFYLLRTIQALHLRCMKENIEYLPPHLTRLFASYASKHFEAEVKNINASHSLTTHTEEKLDSTLASAEQCIYKILIQQTSENKWATTLKKEINTLIQGTQKYKVEFASTESTLTALSQMNMQQDYAAYIIEVERENGKPYTLLGSNLVTLVYPDKIRISADSMVYILATLPRDILLKDSERLFTGENIVIISDYKSNLKSFARTVVDNLDKLYEKQLSC